MYTINSIFIFNVDKRLNIYIAVYGIQDNTKIYYH